MEKLGPLVRVKSVQILQGFEVRVTFENKVVRNINLEPYLHGPIFENIRMDRLLFQAIKVEGGTIAWENGADIDPDVLYYGLTPAWREKEAAGQKAAPG